MIIDDQNLERVLGRKARGACRHRPDHCLALRILCAAGVLGAERRDQTEPRPVSRAAVDVEPPTQQRQSFADAEQAPSGVAALRQFADLRRFESDALIRHGDAQHAVRVDRQIHADPIGMRVLDRVQEQFAHRLEQQRADVLSRGIGERRGRHLDLDPVLVPRPVRQPGEGGG